MRQGGRSAADATGVLGVPGGAVPAASAPDTSVPADPAPAALILAARQRRTRGQEATPKQSASGWPHAVSGSTKASSAWPSVKATTVSRDQRTAGASSPASAPTLAIRPKLMP